MKRSIVGSMVSLSLVACGSGQPDGSSALDTSGAVGTVEEAVQGSPLCGNEPADRYVDVKNTTNWQTFSPDTTYATSTGPHPDCDAVWLTEFDNTYVYSKTSDEFFAGTWGQGMPGQSMCTGAWVSIVWYFNNGGSTWGWIGNTITAQWFSSGNCGWANRVVTNPNGSSKTIPGNSDWLPAAPNLDPPAGPSTKWRVATQAGWIYWYERASDYFDKG